MPAVQLTVQNAGTASFTRGCEMLALEPMRLPSAPPALPRVFPRPQAGSTCDDAKGERANYKASWRAVQVRVCAAWAIQKAPALSPG
jgi:hypothetical protein